MISKLVRGAFRAFGRENLTSTNGGDSNDYAAKVFARDSDVRPKPSLKLVRAVKRSYHKPLCP